MMKFLLLPFMFIQTISCQELPKMKTEVVVNDISAIYVVNQGNKRTKSNSIYVDASKRLSPEIIIKKNPTNEIDYRIQGHVKSGGLNINHPKIIKAQQKIIKDTLLITHQVIIVGMAGKEGGHITGYNYMQDEKISIPNGIRFVKIELHEDFSSQRSKENNRKALVSEKNINLSGDQ